MEGWESVKVEEISRENIKPCISTPIHLKQLKLSLFDQTAAPIPISTLLFYPPNHTTRQTLDIAHLKTTLSRTLDSFYPLAGRYTTWDTIDCNDQGVPFIVTNVHCPLSTVLNYNGSRKLELLSKLYPPTEFAIIGSGIQVAIQMNVFTCGGFVLGWYHSHKPFDGTSAATFLGHWAALASNRNPKLPDFDAGITAFPQYPAEKDPQIRPRMACFDKRSDAINKSLVAETSSFGVDISVRSFVFKRTAVAELRANAVSKDVTNPSRLLTLSAFIWKHLLPDHQHQQRRSALGVTVDVRPRANPPLSNGSIGNLCEMVAVDLADHDSDEPLELPQLVSEIYASISKVKYMISDYNGDRRGESKIANLYEFIKIISKYMGDFYFLVAWCKSAGFADVDFVFGKPKWIIPTHERLIDLLQKNTILLVDYLDSDDDIEYEAWLFLEEKKMTMLESNEEFLNFCSPRF